MSLPAASSPSSAAPSSRSGSKASEGPDWHRIILAELQRRDQADAHTRTSAAVAVREQRYDGAQVLGYARQLLGRYARFPSIASADVAALWAAHTHCRDQAGTWSGAARPD